MPELDRLALVGAAACGVTVGFLLWKSREKISRRESEEDLAPSPFVRANSMTNLLTLTSLQNSLSTEAVAEKKSVTVMVPATSANMGAGFDTIGMAVDMWNEVKLTRSDKFLITCQGEGADDIPLDESNLVVVGVKTVFEAIGQPVPTLHYHLTQRIPHGRGLGSSSAAIVGGLLAGLAISGRKLDVKDSEKLLQLGLKIEGHPDNIAPALYGGIQLGIYSERDKRWKTSRVQIPHGFIFVIFIPAFTGKTADLRRVVPKMIPMADCVFNMGRLAWLLNGLLTNNVEHIKDGFDDRLHQNQRAEAVYPYLNPMIDAAYKAGALGAYLSGSGPCVMAITAGGYGDFFTQSDTAHRKDRDVASAMRDVAEKMGVAGKVYITHSANTGGIVVAADPPFSTAVVAFNGYT